MELYICSEKYHKQICEEVFVALDMLLSKQKLNASFICIIWWAAKAVVIFLTFFVLHIGYFNF